MPGPSEQRLAAFALVNADIAAVSERAGYEFRRLVELINTQKRYPALVPVLIEWVKTVDERTSLTDPRDLGDLRESLYRALTTLDALGTEAVPLLLTQYKVDPPLSDFNSYGLSNALLYLAMPSNFDDIARLAQDRSIGGRSPLLDWLIQQGREDGLQIVVREIEDPKVRPLAIKHLRKFRPLPTGLRPVIEPYLDDPDSEVRKQAKLTLKKLP